jgi:hypothetical protein
MSNIYVAISTPTALTCMSRSIYRCINGGPTLNGLQGSNKNELNNTLTVLVMSATTANAGTFDPTVDPTSTLSPLGP